LMNSNRTIYAPEGWWGKLRKDGGFNPDVNYLYTDGFSTCCILVGIGEVRRVLYHVNMMTVHITDKLAREFKDEVFQHFILVYRQQSLVQELEKILKNLQVPRSCLQVDNDVKGVRISFTQHDDDVVPYVQILRKDLDDIVLRHPLEQQIETVAKLQQVLGLKQKTSGRTTVNDSSNCIYDGNFWAYLDETLITVQDAECLKDLNFLYQADSYFDYSSYLKALVKDTNVPFIGDLMPLAYFIEQYRFNYDSASLLKRNLKQALDSPGKESIEPCSVLEKMFEQKLKRLINEESNQDIFNELTYLLKEFEAEASESVFKEDRVAICQYFLCERSKRRVYELMIEMSASASQLHQQADVAVNQGDTAGAVRLYTESAKLLAVCCMSSSPELAHVLLKGGKLAFKIRDYQTAKELLMKSIYLLKNCTNPLPDDDLLRQARDFMLQTIQEQNKQ